MFSQRFQPINFVIILILGCLLCGLQSTFWFQIFGRTPAPNFFLLLIFYLALFRKRWMGLAQVYLLGPIMAAYTISPTGIVWLLVILIYIFASYAKERVFWPNWRYYMLSSLALTIGYHLMLGGLSWFFDSPRPLEFWRRFGEVVLTVLFAPPFISFMAWVDRLTMKEVAQEGPRHG